MHFERLQSYPLPRLGLDDSALEGPFLLPDNRFGLLVSLRGPHGGSMPTCSELQWTREIPPRVRTEPVSLFVRRRADALFLGTMRFTKRGQPARDGFRALFTLDVPLDDAAWRALIAEANAPPPPAPEEAIAALTESSTTEDRISAMRVFAARWFDCDPDAPELDAPTTIPRPLRILHGLIGGRAVCAQNRLFAPDEIAIEDGKLAFYVENQGVFVWATVPGSDDPAVFVRESGDVLWRPEAPSLSVSLLQLLIIEASYGAPFGASHGALDPRAAMKLTKRLPPLPLPPLTTSGARFLGHAGVVGFTLPNGPDVSVWLGARDQARMEPLEDLIADWPDVRV